MKPILKTLLVILSISLVNCKKEDGKLPPEILTLEISEITSTSAVINGELDDYWEGLEIIVVWSTDPNAVGSSVLNSLCASPGKHFSIEITDLTPDTKYYAIACIGATYAIKKTYGVSNYSEQMEFTTLSE